MTKIPEGKRFLEQRGEITLWIGDTDRYGHVEYGFCFEFNGERYGGYTTHLSGKEKYLNECLTILAKNGRESLSELKKKA